MMHRHWRGFVQRRAYRLYRECVPDIHLPLGLGDGHIDEVSSRSTIFNDEEEDEEDEGEGSVSLDEEGVEAEAEAAPGLVGRIFSRLSGLWYPSVVLEASASLSLEQSQAETNDDSSWGALQDELSSIQADDEGEEEEEEGDEREGARMGTGELMSSTPTGWIGTAGVSEVEERWLGAGQGSLLSDLTLPSALSSSDPVVTTQGEGYAEGVDLSPGILLDFLDHEEGERADSRRRSGEALPSALRSPPPDTAATEIQRLWRGAKARGLSPPMPQPYLAEQPAAARPVPLRFGSSRPTPPRTTTTAAGHASDTEESEDGFALPPSPQSKPSAPYDSRAEPPAHKPASHDSEVKPVDSRFPGSEDKAPASRDSDSESEDGFALPPSPQNHTAAFLSPDPDSEALSVATLDALDASHAAGDEDDDDAGDHVGNTSSDEEFEPGMLPGGRRPIRAAIRQGIFSLVGGGMRMLFGARGPIEENEEEEGPEDPPIETDEVNGEEGKAEAVTIGGIDSQAVEAKPTVEVSVNVSAPAVAPLPDTPPASNLEAMHGHVMDPEPFSVATEGEEEPGLPSPVRVAQVFSPLSPVSLGPSSSVDERSSTELPPMAPHPGVDEVVTPARTLTSAPSPPLAAPFPLGAPGERVGWGMGWPAQASQRGVMGTDLPAEPGSGGAAFAPASPVLLAEASVETTASSWQDDGLMLDSPGGWTEGSDSASHRRLKARRARPRLSPSTVEATDNSDAEAFHAWDVGISVSDYDPRLDMDPPAEPDGESPDGYARSPLRLARVLSPLSPLSFAGEGVYEEEGGSEGEPDPPGIGVEAPGVTFELLQSDGSSESSCPSPEREVSRAVVVELEASLALVRVQGLWRGALARRLMDSVGSGTDEMHQRLRLWRLRRALARDPSGVVLMQTRIRGLLARRVYARVRQVRISWCILCWGKWLWSLVIASLWDILGSCD
jgi:hypothetical protein